jgi:hypothetical protein
VNLEYEIHAKDPLPGMQISFAHMRGVLAGLCREQRRGDVVAGRRKDARLMARSTRCHPV